jgi:hypothetical protein
MKLKQSKPTQSTVLNHVISVLQFMVFVTRITYVMNPTPYNHLQHTEPVAYQGGGVQTPPEILKALQNHAKFNPIVKTVKNC